MKVGAIYQLTDEVLIRAKAEGVTDLVFHLLDPVMDENMLVGFNFHDTSKLTAAGKKYAFLKVKNQIEKLAERKPHLFHFNSYDLSQAIIKDVYWSLIMDNLIEQKCLEIMKPGVKFINLNKRNSIFLDYLKFLFQLLQPLRVATGITTQANLKGILAIRINSLLSISFFGKLFEKLGNKAFVIYHSSQANDSNKIAANFQLKFFNMLVFAYQKRFFITESLKFMSSIFLCQIRFLNLLLFTKRKQIIALSELELLSQNGVRGFLLSASENEGEGIVAGLVAQKYKLKSFNFMNGTKSSDLINGITNFDYWFMHDQKMKKMLLSISNQKEENFPITGHLMEDVAREHVYSGALDLWQNTIAGKKIISVFSSPTYNVEQLEVENLLINYLQKDENLLVFVRLHPREKHNHPYSHERMILLPDFEEKSSAALFDLLLKSHLAISFGSTVSLQASWFGIPSITVEFSEKSTLLYVDQLTIHHVNSIQKLTEFINESLGRDKQKFEHQLAEKSVAEKMSYFLLLE